MFLEGRAKYGGKKNGLLAEGGYGCVFYPSLPCKSLKKFDYSNKVSKLMKRELADDEMVILEKLHIIDPGNVFHIGGEFSCDVGTLNEVQKRETKKCELLDSSLGMNKYKILIQDYGGVSLFKHISELNKREKNVRVLKKTLSSMRNLVIGLDTMHSAGLGYFDVKTDNILINKERNKEMKFIDFGLAQDFEDAKKNLFRFTKSYFPYPMELILINNYKLLKSGSILKKSHLDFLVFSLQHSYGLGSLKNFDKEYVDGSLYMDVFSIECLKLYITTAKTMKREEFIEKMLKKIDIFSFGIVLIEIYKAFIGEKFKVGKKHKPGSFMQKYQTLIEKCVSQQFWKRIDKKMLVNEFSSLFVERNTKKNAKSNRKSKTHKKKK